MIDRDALTTYLDDHLAGAQAALVLLERLESDPADGLDVRELHREIEADRAVLESIVERLGDRPSSVKKAAGWIAGRLSRPKLGDDGALARFESFEVLSLGILGKRALWRVIAELGPAASHLDPLVLEELTQRAQEQYERVERARIACAHGAFGANAR